MLADVFKDTYLRRVPRPARGSLRSRPARAPGCEPAGGFLIELGRDFCFVGDRSIPLQVGGRDFAPRSAVLSPWSCNCLVAIELKVEQVRARASRQARVLPRSPRPRCAQAARATRLSACCSVRTKDSEVVEYALSRSLSPALDRRVPDPVARQEAAPGQAPRVLRAACTATSRRPIEDPRETEEEKRAMIAGLKPYPAYKDSGVPWLGEVPATLGDRAEWQSVLSSETKPASEISRSWRSRSRPACGYGTSMATAASR